MFYCVWCIVETKCGLDKADILEEKFWRKIDLMKSTPNFWHLYKTSNVTDFFHSFSVDIFSVLEKILHKENVKIQLNWAVVKLNVVIVF